MDAAVIILDSDDEDSKNQPPKTTDDIKDKVTEPKVGEKRPAEEDVTSPSNKIRRIQPTKIGEIDDKKKIEANSFEESPKEDAGEKTENGDEKTETTNEPEAGPSKVLNEQTEELEILIKVCRRAEPSEEMKTIIKKKLLRYYHSVHPTYVTSKTFLKTLKSTAEEILKEPHLVYSKLKTIIDELNARRFHRVPEPVEPIASGSGEGEPSEESITPKTTGDDQKDQLLKKLHRGLVALKRHILDLEEEEVDWDEDENSSYIRKVSYEKRACEIYKKICELTGESQHAHRPLKKAIKFKGTSYPEFNKKLQKFVNATNQFPNYRDVLRTLDLCNKKYNYGMSSEVQSRVAQEAFEKLGKQLKDRRRMDLYETATFYVGKTKDPAKDNPELRVSLEKNRNFYARCDDIIDEYAKKEEKALSDDAEEVSSTQTETVAEDPKEDEEPTEDLLVPVPDDCDKNGDTTNISLDDDVMILS